MLSRLAIALSVLVAAQAAPLPAQSVVSPAHFTDAEGPTQNRFPFGSAAPFRFLQLHEDLQPTPRLLRSLAIRRLGWAPSTLADFTRDYAAYSIVISMWMSTATTTAAAPNATFDSNHGTDKAQVLSAVKVDFPASVHAFVPNPFAYAIPLGTPFVYTAKGPLAWEVQMTSSTISGLMYFDHAASTGTNPKLPTSTYGKGCKVTGATAAWAATGDSVPSWPAGTATLVVNGSNGPKSSVAVFVLGFSSTQFGPLPLPFLLPGSSNAPSGPCNLYCDIVAALGLPTDATGGCSAQVPLPAVAALHGARTFEQFLAPDRQANAFGWVTSNGVNHNWLAPLATPVPLARVYVASLAATGTIGPNYGHIVKFN